MINSKQARRRWIIRTLRFFVASSSEVVEFRRDLIIWVDNKNKLLKPRNVQVEIDIWEYKTSAIPATGRSQDEYNKSLAKADFVAVIIKNKVGKYTREEFDTALTLNRTTGRPQICIYMLPPDKPEPSLSEFLSFLHTDSLDYFPVNVISTDMLMYNMYSSGPKAATFYWHAGMP